jgi:4-amino-4-deoxy-L-arabinose transferase-like glycosyltransferase
MPPNGGTQLACAPQEMIPGQGPAGQGANGQPSLGGPNGGPGGGGGTQFSNETGSPGVFRFFTNPLSKQMSWLLPFALISIVLALFASKIQLPIESGIHKALILWGGWLMTCVVFFSMVSGIFHSYYAIMLVPPLGAMVGIGFALLWSWGADQKWVAALLIASTVITLAYQAFATYQYGEKSLWMIGAVILFALGILLVGFQRRTAYILLLAAMLVIPLYWTWMTVVSDSNAPLPTAYQGGNLRARANDGADRASQPGNATNTNAELISYLQANTQDVKYLVATLSAHQGSPMVIETGRPVLLMGGFGGQDDVVNVDDLKSMVANGELRYVLYGENGGGPGGRGAGKQDITNWLKTSCSVVPEFSSVTTGKQPPQGPNQSDGQNPNQPGPGGPGGPDGQMTLYQCQ